jgi:hypothetical protein
LEAWTEEGDEMSQVNFANATIDHLRGFGIQLHTEQWHALRVWLQKSAEDQGVPNRRTDTGPHDSPGRDQVGRLV